MFLCVKALGQCEHNKTEYNVRRYNGSEYNRRPYCSRQRKTNYWLCIEQKFILQISQVFVQKLRVTKNYSNVNQKYLSAYPPTPYYRYRKCSKLTKVFKARRKHVCYDKLSDQAQCPADNKSINGLCLSGVFVNLRGWFIALFIFIYLFIKIYLYWIGQLHCCILPWRPVKKNDTKQYV